MALSVLTLLLTFSLSLTTTLHAAEKRLRILVTNDDGFESRGIQVLTRELSTFAHVLTVAPVSDQSGASLSTTVLKGKIWVIPHRRDGKLIGYQRHNCPVKLT